MKRSLALLLCLLAHPLVAKSGHTYLDYKAWVKNQTDLVIFSYNRPLQLYAFLESMEKYVQNLNRVHVIYRTTDARFEKAYRTVFKDFPYVIPHLQGKNAPHDFKQLLLRSAFDKKSRCPHIMFAVDDNIMTDYVDIVKCTKAMKKLDTWCFSLRMGKNVTHTILNPTVSLNRVFIGLPNGKNVKRSMYKWQFNDLTSKGSWAYPNSVDITIYRKKEIKRFMTKAKYHSPNTFEAEWHWHWKPKHKYGLCFTHSKGLNIPLNVVNPDWTSANLNISPYQLLDRFMKGEKLDISPYKKINNTAPHMSYDPNFIPRTPKYPD